jgi:phage repressor protein C with HTH and peptisase S24 domain
MTCLLLTKQLVTMSTNNLALSAYQYVGRPSPMTPGQIIGRNVRRIREARGMSVNALAKAIGAKSVFTVQQIEAGKTLKSKYLPDIARVLKVDLGEIDPSQRNSVKDEIEQSRVDISASVGLRDVPVYATTEGGDGIMVLSSEPVDVTDRPSSIARVKDAYGIIVTGESMVPILRPGDTVIVNPHLPPRPEDLCVFRVEREGEFRSTVKEFVRKVPDGWRVKRYRPKEREYVLKVADWDNCHVVVAIHKR